MVMVGGYGCWCWFRSLCMLVSFVVVVGSGSAPVLCSASQTQNCEMLDRHNDEMVDDNMHTIRRSTGRVEEKRRQ